jgi:integrase
VRSGEARGALWSEIDLPGRVWAIPAVRMKTAAAHRVPLSDRAAEIIEERVKFKQGPLVFAGRLADIPVSAEALRHTLKRMGHCGLTIHGFRASFRTWASEQTNFPREIAEAALAHAVGSEIERTYARTDFFDHRRRLMDNWAAYCSRPTAERAAVTALHARGGGHV